MAIQAHSTVTISEAAGLIGVERHLIRNEFQRVLGKRPTGDARRSRGSNLEFSDLLYFCVIEMLKDEGLDLLPGARRGLYAVLQKKAPAEASAWKRVDDRVSLGGRIPLEFALNEVSKALEATWNSYNRGRELVLRDPKVLGGEPVFSGTRIPVRHIVDLIKRGIEATEIRADYPNLPEEAVEYARIKARIGNGPGRPRKPLAVQRAGA